MGGLVLNYDLVQILHNRLAIGTNGTDVLIFHRLDLLSGISVLIILHLVAVHRKGDGL